MRKWTGFRSIYNFDVKSDPIQTIEAIRNDIVVRHILTQNDPRVFNWDYKYRINGTRNLQYRQREMIEENRRRRNHVLDVRHTNDTITSICNSRNESIDSSG